MICEYRSAPISSVAISYPFLCVGLTHVGSVVGADV